MKQIAPLPRNKRRSILLISGVYDEVIKEMKEVVIKNMIESATVKKDEHDGTVI